MEDNISLQKGEKIVYRKNLRDILEEPEVSYRMGITLIFLSVIAYSLSSLLFFELFGVIDIFTRDVTDDVLYLISFLIFGTSILLIGLIAVLGYKQDKPMIITNKRLILEVDFGIFFPKKSPYGTSLKDIDWVKYLEWTKSIGNFETPPTLKIKVKGKTKPRNVNLEGLKEDERRKFLDKLKEVLGEKYSEEIG